jgi:hypothetical protein
MYKEIAGERPKSAIIVVNDHITVVNILTFSTNYLSICNVEFNNKLITLLSAYCAPNNDLLSELNVIQNAINNIRSDGVLVAIDSNAHSRVWFNEYDDNRGEAINDFIAINFIK